VLGSRPGRMPIATLHGIVKVCPYGCASGVLRMRGERISCQVCDLISASNPDEVTERVSWGRPYQGSRLSLLLNSSSSLFSFLSLSEKNIGPAQEA
jgi:hypothetical protein